MKSLLAILLIVIIGCNDDAKTDKTVVKDSISDEKTPPVGKDTVTAQPKIYSNARFKDVTITKLSEGKYEIKGKGQIFEANFSWVVEDGHDELLQGHQMTDAGAPEWGNFSFIIDVNKQRPNSSLTLILFEISAKDGSRQHELPIPLNQNTQ